MTLPDGSLVRLNAGSTLDYSFDRKKRIRKLHLRGEGFFDVARSDCPL
jgi:ferric-dicitrate binding protein FerR (iron transport regulator)